MKFKWLFPLFNADGDIGAASEQTEVTEQSSVETFDQIDQTDTEIASASAPDVTQQESFAKRLKEEKEILEQQYQPHKQVYSKAEQIAKAAGFATVDDYFAAVDAQLAQQAAEQEAQRLQMDVDAYNQHIAPVQNELTQAKQELARLQQTDLERQIKADYDRLSAQYPDFKDHEEAVWALATERRLPLEDAYKLVSYDSRIAATKLETEQQVLANITGRDQKQVLSAGDKGNTTTLDPSTMSLKDIADISARVQRGERITF